MSGRETVRDLRENGRLAGPTEPSSLKRALIIIAVGGTVGALGYLGAVFVAPRLIPTIVHLTQKPQPPPHYAKPGG